MMHVAQVVNTARLHTFWCLSTTELISLRFSEDFDGQRIYVGAERLRIPSLSQHEIIGVGKLARLLRSKSHIVLDRCIPCLPSLRQPMMSNIYTRNR